MVYHLKRRGSRVGRKRVRRLMAKMGLAVIYQKPRTSQPHPENRVYPYLLRGLAVTRPDQVWCTDVTYIPMRRGFLYLVAIMDWYSRWVLSWRLSNTLEPSFCCEALEEALNRYDPPEIFNTDQGSQFTSTGVHGTTQRGRGAYLDGRERPLDGQRLHRASVAFTQIRMRLSERFRNRVGSPSRDRPLDRPIQQRETSLGARWADAGGGVHWLEKTF